MRGGQITAALAVVVCAALVCGSLGDGLPARDVQTIPIHYNHIVTLMVGQHEGRWVRFRMRWDLDQSYLFVAPSSFSNTWRSLAIPDEYDQPRVSDLISIGSAVRRIPFVVGLAPGDQRETSDGVTYEGVLGLGPASALWHSWQAHTYQSSELTLGKAMPHRKSAPGSASIRSRALPMWMTLSLRNIGINVPYGMRLHARFGDSDAKNFRRLCAQSEGDDVVFSAAQESPHLASLIDFNFTHAEHCERLANINYTVIVSPASDYTVLPPQMLLLTQEHLPVHLRVWSDLTGLDGASKMSLFDPRGDFFVVARNDAPFQTSACTFGDREDFILIGGATLRRFTWAYDAFTGYSWLTESVSALSDEGGTYSRPPESYILFAGALIWVAWAVILYPIWNPGVAKKVPAVADVAESSQVRVTVSNQQQQQQQQSAHGMSELRIARLPHNMESESRPSSPAPTHTPTPKSKHDALYIARMMSAHESIINSNVQWPYSLEVIRQLQLQTSLIVLLIVYLSVAHLDAVHFLSELMHTDITGAGVAFGAWFFVILMLCATAFITIDRMPSLSACLVQLPILMALMALDVSAIRADISVLVLICLVSVATTVALACATRVILQMGFTRAIPMCILASGTAAFVLAAAILVLMPFAIERMWGEHPTAMLMSACMVLVVAVPASLYIVQGELIYPINVLREYGEHMRKELGVTIKSK